jgi:RNA polymerase sigma-70 factor, ECF subfamily
MSGEKSAFHVIMTRAPGPLRTGIAAARAPIEARLAVLWREASGAWPELSVPQADFLGYLAERLPEDQEPLAALAGVQAADLYLACALTRGDGQAMILFEERVMAATDHALARVTTADGAEEAKQVVRERLLVGDGGSPGKIRDYTGRGKLESFVRMCAVRVAHNLRRSVVREVLLGEDELLERLLPAEDQELAGLKDTYRAEFRAAFQAAVQGLGQRERILLKQHLVDRLSSGELAGLYRVHRATVSRWIASAQEALVRATRGGLMDRLGVSPEELESVMRLIESRLEASVYRLLDGDQD